MLKKIKNIVIVGGGTSAWLSAGFLNNNLKNINITVVDKEIGSPVGVGEGTLLGFDHFLQRCGWPKSEWFNEIEATYKSGILFPNWGSKDNLVWHPFLLNPYNKDYNASLYEAWTHHQDIDFTELSALWNTLENNTVDVSKTSSYALHVDCSKLVQWIQNKLQNDVTLIKSEMININRDDCGYIESIDLLNGTNVKGDLFLDCTGFKQLLQDNPERVNLYGRLFCDTAIAGRIPYDNVELERKPYVISEAVDHGWIWNIPTQSRTGSGLVFNRSVTSIDEAKEYFVNYWDNRISKDDLAVIDWTPYYVKNPWDKNVVAIGLSGGFIEPLESSGLATITNGIMDLTSILKGRVYTKYNSKMYNARMEYCYEDTCDFINMHYSKSDFDTPFWNWVRETQKHSEMQTYYEEILSQGDEIPQSERGFMFFGANWACWLFQLNKSVIAPNKNVSNEDAKKIIEDWQEKQQSRTFVSHSSALENVPLYFNTTPQYIPWLDEK